MLTTRLASFEDMINDSYKNIVSELNEPFKIHRKQWEFVSIIQAIKTAGLLSSGKRGLGFGVGTEPLPAYFAKYGCEILATDQPPTNANTKNWVGANLYCSELNDLKKPNICDEVTFNKLVSFKHIDMNWIPTDLGKFDFIWSACALEHLGTLHHGLFFILHTMSMLNKGGIAVHTTEFNINSEIATNDYKLNNIYRTSDILRLKSIVTNIGGYEIPGINLSRSNHPANTFIDSWPNYNNGITGPHINLKIDEFDSTSIIIIIKKL